MPTTIAPSWSCLVLVMPCSAIAYTNRVNLPDVIRLTVVALLCRLK